jgi:hypothetical protein
VCEFTWFAKKPASLQALATKYLREEEANKAFGEEKSLANVLKELTSTYIICKDCFDSGNYPKVMNATDFEPQTVKSALNTNSMFGREEIKTLSVEDREKLLN